MTVGPLFEPFTLTMQLTPDGLRLFAAMVGSPLPGCAPGTWLDVMEPVEEPALDFGIVQDSDLNRHNDRMVARMSAADRDDEDELVRPTTDEVCPRCGGKHIAASTEIPPMSCGDCGDRWAGLYRQRIEIDMPAVETRSIEHLAGFDVGRTHPQG